MAPSSRLAISSHHRGTTSHHPIVSSSHHHPDDCISWRGGLANSCTFEYADGFCASTYGGQLTSLNTQYEYDQVEKITHGAEQHLMLGMHSDGQGHWEYVDGAPANMEFLTVRARLGRLIKHP